MAKPSPDTSQIYLTSPQMGYADWAICRGGSRRELGAARRAVVARSLFQAQVTNETYKSYGGAGRTSACCCVSILSTMGMGSIYTRFEGSCFAVRGLTA